jgi:hypothetical protein
MADSINIKNAPERTLTHVVGHDVNGKGGRQNVGQAGGLAGPLDGSGKVPASQLPPLDHDVGQAANQAAMLALPVTAPAVCIRTDFAPAHVFYLTADPASTLANWVDTGEFGAGGANPSAPVGLTAVNGAAATFMRSDAAPSLSQAITPTWTAHHVFAAVSAATTPSVAVTSTNPQIDFNLSSGAVDAKRWNWTAGTNTYGLRTLNDAGTTGSNAWNLTRTGNAVTQQNWYISGTALLGLNATGFVTIVPHTVVVSGANGNKQWLARFTSGTGHTNAPTAFDATANYLQVGGREYGNNGFSGIGFGYVGDTTQHPCVMIGHEEKQTAANTAGDFIVATRNATTNTPPTIQLRVTMAGQILAEQASYTPGSDQALATKKYVDDSVSSAIVGNGNWGAPVDHSGSGDIFIEPTSAMVHRVSATTGDVFVRLSDAPAGTVKIIKRMDDSAHGFHVNLEIASPNTIDGVQDIGIADQYSCRIFMSDGTNWSIIGTFGN